MSRYFQTSQRPQCWNAKSSCSSPGSWETITSLTNGDFLSNSLSSRKTHRLFVQTRRRLRCSDVVGFYFCTTIQSQVEESPETGNDQPVVVWKAQKIQVCKSGLTQLFSANILNSGTPPILIADRYTLSFLQLTLYCFFFPLDYKTSLFS